MPAPDDRLRQAELFASARASFDASCAGITRVALDDRSWVDYAKCWVDGSAALFEAVTASHAWEQRTRRLFDRDVIEPRLTASWSIDSGTALQPALLEPMRASLSRRYGVQFTSVGFNLYRDGRDSVAWHRDHIAWEIDQPVIAIVSLGQRRKLLLRPRGGGPSRAFLLGEGDLLVMGGRTNRDWEHCLPKRARAQPRLSVTFRYGMDKRGAYSDSR